MLYVQVSQVILIKVYDTKKRHKNLRIYQIFSKFVLQKTFTVILMPSHKINKFFSDISKFFEEKSAESAVSYLSQTLTGLSLPEKVLFGKETRSVSLSMTRICPTWHSCSKAFAPSPDIPNPQSSNLIN